jgi:hypothetical protein
MMRGFVLTLDMALASAGVVVLFFILLSSQNPPMEPQSPSFLRAQDAAMNWMYTGYVPPIPSSDTYFCRTVFRPRVTNDRIDPSLASDWDEMDICVEGP